MLPSNFWNLLSYFVGTLTSPLPPLAPSLIQLHHNFHKSLGCDVAQAVAFMCLEECLNALLSMICATVLASLVLFEYVVVVNHRVGESENLVLTVDYALQRPGSDNVNAAFKSETAHVSRSNVPVNHI
jgi:hypothetical protein